MQIFEPDPLVVMHSSTTGSFFPCTDARSANPARGVARHSLCAGTRPFSRELCAHLTTRPDHPRLPIRFLSIGPRLRFTLSGRFVTSAPLRFPSLAVTCSGEDFHLHVSAHAARTNAKAPRSDTPGRFFGPFHTVRCEFRLLSTSSATGES